MSDSEKSLGLFGRTHVKIPRASPRTETGDAPRRRIGRLYRRFAEQIRRMREDGLMPKPRKVDGRNLNIIAELDKALAALPINDRGRE